MTYPNDDPENPADFDVVCQYCHHHETFGEATLANAEGCPNNPYGNTSHDFALTTEYVAANEEKATPYRETVEIAMPHAP